MSLVLYIRPSEAEIKLGGTDAFANRVSWTPHSAITDPVQAVQKLIEEFPDIYRQNTEFVVQKETAFGMPTSLHLVKLEARLVAVAG